MFKASSRYVRQIQNVIECIVDIVRCWSRFKASSRHVGKFNTYPRMHRWYSSVYEIGQGSWLLTTRDTDLCLAFGLVMGVRFWWYCKWHSDGVLLGLKTKGKAWGKAAPQTMPNQRERKNTSIETETWLWWSLLDVAISLGPPQPLQFGLKCVFT